MDIKPKMDYGLKNTLNSEGTEKEMKRRKTRQHKLRKGEERKSSRQTLWCNFGTR